MAVQLEVLNVSNDNFLRAKNQIFGPSKLVASQKVDPASAQEPFAPRSSDLDSGKTPRHAGRLYSVSKVPHRIRSPVA